MLRRQAGGAASRAAGPARRRNGVAETREEEGMLPQEPTPTVAEAVQISLEGFRGGRPRARQS